MPLRLSAALLFLCGLSTLAGAQARPDLRVPLGARWTMSLEQARRLPGLDRTPRGSLQASSFIRSNSQVEFDTRWQGRTVSFLFARGFGLYAIGVEMTPWAAQHSAAVADTEQRDLEQCAPIRLAIIRKYETPQGMVESWDDLKVLPLSAGWDTAATFSEARAIDWPYGRNWLAWEGEETRLALGEQFVWYVSKAGLAYREKERLALEKEGLAAQARDKERLVKRQSQLKQARENVLSRAQELEALF
jgi:hypothetical protein